MEMDNEVSGNSYTTQFRQYDPRLGRWKSLDPLMQQFPWMSPYVALNNNPVYYTDIYGMSSDGPGEPEKKGETFIGDDGVEHTITHSGVSVSATKVIAKGDNTPGVGPDMGSRKINKISPGGTPINDPQPIYNDIGYSIAIRERVLFYSEDQLFDELYKLVDEFSDGASAEKMSKDLVDHFKNNTGENYSSWSLTKAAKDHPSTKRFIVQIKKAFDTEIKKKKGYTNDGSFSIKKYLVGHPRFNEVGSFWGAGSGDEDNGLMISVNDTWSYKIEVVSYKEVQGQYEAEIRLILYDHYGLNISDITEHEYASTYHGFYSWYILQWAKGFKPFITVMNIPTFKVSGSLNK